MDELRRAVRLNLTCTSNRALADIEKLGGSANWQTLAVLVGAELERRESRRHHGALGFRQVPAPEVQADNVAERIAAAVQLEPRHDSHLLAGRVTVAAVEDL